MVTTHTATGRNIKSIRNQTHESRSEMNENELKRQAGALDLQVRARRI
jgi:hypothetical protein